MMPPRHGLKGQLRFLVPGVGGMQAVYTYPEAIDILGQ